MTRVNRYRPLKNFFQSATDAGWLTTGQVAKLCGVAPRTAVLMTKRGLKYCLIPGTKDRRIHRDDLRAYLAQYPGWHRQIALLDSGHIPGAPAVLLYGLHPEGADLYRGLLVSGGYSVVTARDEFGVGVVAGGSTFAAGVFGLGAQYGVAVPLLQRQPLARLAAVIPDDWPLEETAVRFAQMGFVSVYKSDADPETILSEVLNHARPTPLAKGCCEAAP